MRIFVLTNGWVLKGILDESNSTLTKAGCIRRWGTSAGVGELANGPKECTKVDSLPDGTKLNKEFILFSFNAEGWE